MHRSRNTNLSEESFNALMDALGFVDVENHQLEGVHPLKTKSTTHDDTSYLPRDPTTPFAGQKLEWQPSAFDEAVLFKREFLADYDFGPDLDGDSGDCDYSKLNDLWVLL